MPGVARWPGRIQPGSSSDRVTLTRDIFATLCDEAGAKPPADIDAASFMPTLLGQLQPEHPRDLCFVRREGGLLYYGKTIEALTCGNWKLVLDSPFAPLELFNLKIDPREASILKDFAWDCRAASYATDDNDLGGHRFRGVQAVLLTLGAGLLGEAVSWFLRLFQPGFLVLHHNAEYLLHLRGGGISHSRNWSRVRNRRTFTLASLRFKASTVSLVEKPPASRSRKTVRCFSSNCANA